MRHLRLLTIAACTLAALLPSTAAVEGPMPPVRLNGNYFQRNGRPFIPTGVHWVPAKAAMQWPMEWDPASVEADFRKMRELGVNTVRLDLVWAWFEPRPGDYNPAAFAQLDELVKLARRYEIYLQPSLFIGNEVGEAIWDVPWRNGRHPHADPEMLRLETNLAAEFGRRYANETAIESWDLTDEPPFWNAGKTTDAMAINWTRLISGAIRRVDSLHPIVVGTDAQDIGHGPFRPDNILSEVDLLSVHPYPALSRSSARRKNDICRGLSSGSVRRRGQACHGTGDGRFLGAADARPDRALLARQPVLGAWSRRQRLPVVVLHGCGSGDLPADSVPPRAA